jgi:hypothetical protein
MNIKSVEIRGLPTLHKTLNYGPVTAPACQTESNQPLRVFPGVDTRRRVVSQYTIHALNIATDACQRQRGTANTIGTVDIGRRLMAKQSIHTGELIILAAQHERGLSALDSGSALRLGVDIRRRVVREQSIHARNMTSLTCKHQRGESTLGLHCVNVNGRMVRKQSIDAINLAVLTGQH